MIDYASSQYVTPPSPLTPSSPLSPTSSVSPGFPDSPAHKLDNKKSVRPYKTNDEYLYAMKEDLAVWFNELYSTNLTAENLIEKLQDGTFLCQHANNIRSHIESLDEHQGSVPSVIFRPVGKTGSFQARDNIANFIYWVKSHLHVNDVLLFESDDLVLNKNERNVILCLLEVARKGARYGMCVPLLIQFEQEIDALEQKIKHAEDRRNSQEIVNSDLAASCTSDDTDSDKASLDEWVQRAVRKCTCPKQFPLINVSKGKYRIGYTQNVVFVRILRNHVMIRVGGGWDTLEHYLDKHDPCRCRRVSHSDQSEKITAKVTPRSRSTSLNNVNISSVHSTPVKHSRSNSKDILESDLVITRDDSGRHMLEDAIPSSPPPVGTSANITNSPKKTLTKSPKKKNSKPQMSTNHLSPAKSKNHDSMRRSSSPSQDLIRKIKENIRPSSPSLSNRPALSRRTGSTTQLADLDSHSRSNSRTRKGYRSTASSRDCSPATPRTRHTRNRSLSSCETPRSMTPSLSRSATPDFTLEETTKSPIRKLSLQASPRKYSRNMSASSIPTRIPIPKYYIDSGQPSDSAELINNNNNNEYVKGTEKATRASPDVHMLSSTSTMDSMDSLKTV